MSRSSRLGAAFLGVAIVAALAVPTASAASSDTGTVSAVPGQVLVTWQPGTDATARDQVRRSHGLTTREVVPGLDLEAVGIPSGDPVGVAQRVQAEPAVAIAEPNYLLEAEAVDDPDYGDLWGLHNTGQDDGVADVDIDAPEAWQHTTGDPGVVVAVIDTGMDVRHPDLAPNIWTNTDEVPDNDVDDDGNGYVDDVHGWDFVDDDPNVRQTPAEDQHGTHVAGTIAAVGGNGEGVVGVAPDVRLMPLRFLGSGDGAGSTLDAVRAVDYAAANGARVVNTSWGGHDGGDTLRNAIARASGLVVVAASGNHALDLDSTPRYPAAWADDVHGVGNVLSVTAVNRTGQLASYANFGSTTVDVAAPGSSIWSTKPAGEYGWSSGTSMAAPHASGVAALAASLDHGLNGAELVDLVKGGARALDVLASVTTTGGLVNAAATVELLVDGEVSATAVAGSASGDLAAGETLTTDTAGTGATGDVPVHTAVHVPVAGTVDITGQAPTTSAPDGWSLLDVQVAVVAPGGTTEAPLQLTFTFDGSLDARGAVVFRGGMPVAECPGATTATPDPCVTARATVGDDALMSVLASRGGTFNVGRPTTACPDGRVPATGFTDLPGGVHDPAIACMVWWGVANGVSADRFAPDGTVTRGQMASFVAQAVRATSTVLPTDTDPFDDDDGSVHEADIGALAGAGIVQGVADGQYAPRREVTRAEMAAFLVRADAYVHGTRPTADGDVFVDDDGNVHEDAINAAHAAGLVRGTGEDTYSPARTVTRAEMATFLSRLLDRAVAAGRARTPA